MIEPVSISPVALEEVKKILASKGIPLDYGLRIGVKGGGCGVTFKLGFDHKKADDIEYFVDSIQVLIQKKEAMFLVGKRVDFVDENDSRGFVFLAE